MIKRRNHTAGVAGIRNLRLWACSTGLLLLFMALSALGASDIRRALLLGFEGKVELSRAPRMVWTAAFTNQVLLPGDHLRTGERSRATVQLSEFTVIRIGELAHLLVPPEARAAPGLSILKGVLYFFHRNQPGYFRFDTPSVATVIRGTEFYLEVDELGKTTVQVLDGEVEMSNEQGELFLSTGQAGVARPGEAPAQTAAIEARNLIQWALYYPGILDLNELALSPEEETVLASSLAAYRDGDLLAALSTYPPSRQPASPSETVYLAGLLLAVGQVEQSETLLDSIAPAGPEEFVPKRLASALRRVVAAVKFQLNGPADLSHHPALATEWLAESYYLQAAAQLPEALLAARQAVAQSPNFAFAWTRLAELEFSFGRHGAAGKALDKSLVLANRNAQAMVLQGFVATARNQLDQAIAFFERAIAVDSALGYAWLGRGLCRIRRGQIEAGRQDLQIAAALEPQRALLRSYLAKAFSQENDRVHARKEIILAQQLDPADPTAWLYSALMAQQGNRLNEAVRDLERSQELNDNRRVYRSRLLLDQDRAVRGANLAAIYQDAGLGEVAAREAARAVNVDYANYSAHLFLANSYDALRDPRQINLRYETPWLSEYLVANLLAPVGAGMLSPYVSQQEYGKLFERDRVGLSSSTEYLSEGDWFQTASQFGTFGKSSYAADLAYRRENGQRPNNDLDQLTLSLKLKQQLTPKDTVYAQAVYYRAEAGDLTPYYHQEQAALGLRTKETQEPIVLAGYHHDWQPGVHTLLLAGRLQDTLRLTNSQQPNLLFQKDLTGSVLAVLPGTTAEQYRSSLDIYSLEAQQIFQREQYAVIFGGRYQTGEFQTRSRLAVSDSSFVNPSGTAVPALWFDQTPQAFEPDFERINGYAYLHWQLVRPLRLISGVSYDQLTVPENFRFAPLSKSQRRSHQLSPKAGLIWTPFTNTTFRAAYTRSLGGASFDQSFQLEPTQIAGFNQAWRSLIPDAVAGANAGAEFETFGLAIDQKFPTHTYLGLKAELLKSEVDRVLGVFDLNPPATLAPPYVFPSSARERLRYEEYSLAGGFHQLLGEDWSFGFTYRISSARLDERFPDLSKSVPAAHGFTAARELRATLHQADFVLRYSHPSGFFAQVNSLWIGQRNSGYAPALPASHFWQVNALAGYRFFNRRAEARLGVLNLTGQDYHLNPLNLTPQLPRDRTLLLALNVFF